MGKAKGREPTMDQLAIVNAEPGRGDERVSYYARAYARLATRRSLGMGCVGPIPLDAIEDWCDRRGFDDRETEVFTRIIMTVDADTQRKQAIRLRSK